MLKQFYRTSILLGESAVDYLATRHVIVAGLGGVGGQVAEALARAGIGRLTLIDNDVVDITNINRQLIATLPDVGQPKAALFAKRIAEINPQCRVDACQEFIQEDNLAVLIKADADYVIDCIDTVQSKVALVAYCVHNKINIASSMGAGNRYDVTRVKLADISKTTMCALARVMRLKLKERGVNKGVVVAYSQEHRASAPLEQGKGQRPVNGTISYLPPLFGLMLAGHVLKTLIDSNKGR